jgi:hypothetical protein
MTGAGGERAGISRYVDIDEVLSLTLSRLADVDKLESLP